MSDDNAPVGNLVENPSQFLPISEILIQQVENCRGVITPADVADLVEDIEKQGLLQPVVVRHSLPGDNTDKKYVLVAGFRRTLAHIVLKRPEIHAVVTNLSANDSLIVNLQENVKRCQLTILQEATAIQRIVERFGWGSYEKVGKRLGKSISWVQVRVALLKCVPELQAEAAKGTIRQDYILRLADKPPREQLITLQQVKVALEKNIKIDTILSKTKAPAADKKTRRSPKQMLDMSEHFIEVFSENPASTVLAWALGNISDNDVNERMNRMFPDQWTDVSFDDGTPKLISETIPTPPVIGK